MILIPEQRPMTGSEVQGAWSDYERLHHYQLQKAFEMIAKGVLPQGSLEETVPPPVFPQSTVLLEDPYVLQSMAFEYYRNACITILLGIALTVQTLKLATEEFSLATAQQLAGIIIITVIFSYPFARKKQIYQSLLDEIGKN